MEQRAAAGSGVQVGRGGPGGARGDATALARAVAHARPVALAGEHVLPVLDALVPLFPDGGLRRGTVVAMAGGAASSLALAVVAGPSAAGSWVGAVGLPSLGLVAAAEAGVALDRLVLVADPGGNGDWPTVVATLVDGMDVVVVRPPRSLRAGDARRLQARARDRGAVVVVVGPSVALEPELTLTAADAEWYGLEDGAGHLRARRLTVEANGRRAGARRRQAVLWLPHADGGTRPDDVPARVVPLRDTG